VKAAFIRQHGGIEALEVGELPLPTPGPGEVRVKVLYSSLNHLDLWIRGGIPGIHVSFPHILGSDAAGIVDSLGPGTTGFTAGDEVIIHPGLNCGKCPRCLDNWESLCPQYKILGEQVCGTNAEYVCVPAQNLFLKPKKISFQEAAALPLVFTTAWQMLVRRAQIQSGEFVLIHGAGSGVSTAGIQIAKLFQAEIAVTSGSDEKLKRAESLGARHLINYKKQDFGKEVRKLKPGGPDIIFDHVGKDFWEKNIKCIAKGGRLVTCGATSGNQAVTDLNHVFFRQIQIQGSTMGSKLDFPLILSHVEAGSLRPVVDREFPLKDIALAHRRMSEQGQFGKILLSH
jgi:NADPH:quinone reductase-like Zn-dependent oxidoreductase